MKIARMGAIGLLTVALWFGATPLAASAASPDDVDVDPRIAQLLEQNPGGILIDGTHAVWPGLDMEVSVPRTGGFASRSVGGCTTGRICAYTGQLTGLTVSWGTCGTLAVPSGFVPRSLANARGSGYAQARSSGGSVLGTAYAGGWSAVGGTATTVRCVF